MDGVIRAAVPYKPRPEQLEIHEAMWKHRFGVIVCHRRLGKTVLAVNHLIRCAATQPKDRHPPPRYAYIAPTYRQGKAIAWDYFQHYAGAIPGVVVNQSELKVDLPNGAQVRIYGADNPNSLRGLYFDGVVHDEFGMHPPNIYSEVIRATLMDQHGWALFMGTPAGKNQFYDMKQQSLEHEAKGDKDWFYKEYPVSQTKLISDEELDRAKHDMTPDEYAQEFQCSFEASVKGAIYANEMAQAHAEGRVTHLPYEPALPVDTDWDLGIGDAMAVWFSQTTRGGEVRLIDYYEASGEGFPFYKTVLDGKGYTYGQHWAPHDIQVRELGSGRSRLEVAANLGIRFELTPRLQKGIRGEIEEGIHAARMLLPRCWFDAEKCKAGIEALKHYRRDYNMRLDEFKVTPVHDWSSHAADAFRGLAARQGDRVMTQARVDMPENFAWV